MAAERCGVPFVTTFHGTYRTGGTLKQRYNSIMARGERVIAISNFIAEHVHSVYGVPMSRLPVIHRGTDLEHFNPDNVSAQRLITQAARWRIEDGFPLVLLPGRLTRWKGQSVLIEAMARLQRRDLRCIILGSDQGRSSYRRELESLIVARHLGGIVRLIERADDLPAAYMLSDVVVSASIEPEAFGRVLVEAQALGRPVIGTDHGGARETVVDGETGWLVPPGDPDALAGALDRAIRLTPSQRMSIAKQGRAHVGAHFSRDIMCAKTLDVYNEVLGGRG